MTDLKIPIALVFAMLAQVVAAVWWVSEQAHQIEQMRGEIKTLTEAVVQLEIDADDLIKFAEFTENKWREGYDQDPSYTRIFGQK